MDQTGSRFRPDRSELEGEQAEQKLLGRDEICLTVPADQIAEGREVVEALERLKVPDESKMGSRELSCWRENKKTITNSLKTLSSQIYSAKTRILYEIIQNADDCSFESDSDIADAGVGGGGAEGNRELRELLVECSDEALVAFHNEKGFQPKDLYAMCQVGESSKAPGSGKIGRKGIGFKSVFQICDRPVVLSPPFQFCFDTVKHQVFGYIVPSWVDNPEEHIPQQHRKHLTRIVGPGGATETGTLLVCPVAPRVRGLDLMRDLVFDGLSLAFLKNLEKISFFSSVSRSPMRGEEVEMSTSANERSRRGSVHWFHRAQVDITGKQGFADIVLKGIQVVSHKLYQCSIFQQENGVESRREYRLHTYTILKYKDTTADSGAQGAAAKYLDVTTTISLAFPVDDTLAPLRSAEGELIFAYLPVTAAGFGFAINADFELVASRQDVSDSDNGNHVLLGRIPPIFVHAILTDPVLGEEAFATYLPDLETIRRDRSGGGRKWRTLASALHRETGAWMLIPTEDAPERVKRKHAVLRPKHLSQTLVPNSLLREVTSNPETGEQNFAHADAVVDMALEACIPVCPVEVVLACIRTVLEPFERDLLQIELVESCADGVSGKGAKKKVIGSNKGKSLYFEAGHGGGDWEDGSRWRCNAQDTPAAAGACLSEELLRDIWRYLAVECEACLKQGEAGKSSLRLIVDAVVGGMDSWNPKYSCLPFDHSSVTTSKPFRIFPILGTSRLRRHSENGVSLCASLSPTLSAQGKCVLRLAQRVLPRFDSARLQGIDGIAEILHFLRVGEATELELEQQLRSCFRFGIATTADAQLFWDAFRYAVVRGFSLGLADFMPGVAIGLPVAGGVVSSRDVQRLSVGLPCFLGLCRKPKSGNKYLLTIPPKATAWYSRVRWELAMVQAFGVTYPKSDVDRIQVGEMVMDLLYAVALAREAGMVETLEALGELFDIYESRMGSMMLRLRQTAQSSPRLAECLLERRTHSKPFTCSCSPKFVDEVLTFCNVKLADDSFHNIRDLLGSALGTLHLKASTQADKPASDDASAAGVADTELDGAANLEFETANETAENENVEVVSVGDEHEGTDDEEVDVNAGAGDVEVCEEATWELLERLLGFHHTFEAKHCAWLLYSVLTPALTQRRPENCEHAPLISASDPMIASIKPFLIELEIGTLRSVADGEKCEMDVAADLWPLICQNGGIWLSGDFVSLQRCVWKFENESSKISAALIDCSCMAGTVCALEPMLMERMDELGPISSSGNESPDDSGPKPVEDVDDSLVPLDRGEKVEKIMGRDRRKAFLEEMRSCCMKGAAKREATGLRFPSLPYFSDLEMMLYSTLPMLLEREFDAVHDAVRGHGWEHRLSAQVISCYDAVIATLIDDGFPAVHRWMIPVPSTQFQTRHVIVDRGFNRQLARDLEALLVLPAASDCPTAAAFVLRHFGQDCIHQDLVSLFAPVVERQSVGLESPCDRVHRTFKRSLRLAVTDAGDLPGDAGAEAVDRMHESIDQIWSLIGEVQATIPSGLTDADSWDLLMWAAIACAKQWFTMQTASSPQHASRYQETVQRVRQLVPFIKRTSRAESWGLLAERQDEPAAGESNAARGILLLRTLFGFELWGNLTGLQLLERGFALPLDIPSRVLRACADSDSDSQENGSFPEEFGRVSLVLIWEWFLLEVAGAAPPTVLWSSLHEPIIVRARHGIRQAEAGLREQWHDGLCLRLLDYLCENTQMGMLMDEMDAEDEARAAAAAREAEARRREREEAQQRRREEAERAAAAAAQARRREEAEAEAAREMQEAQQRLVMSAQERERHAAEHARRAMARADGRQQPSVAGVDDRPQQRLLQGPFFLRDMASQLALMFDVGEEWEAGGAAGSRQGPSVRRQTIRKAEVKGKLARFMAGIRAYQRQRAADGSAQQVLPSVLSDFVAWAGDLLEGEQQGGRSGGMGGDQLGGESASRIQEVARRYVAGSAAREDGDEEDADELCCICLEVLRDAAVHDWLGEPLETACGHKFHAVCYAKTMENSEQDPTCPICRSDLFGNLRFV